MAKSAPFLETGDLCNSLLFGYYEFLSVVHTVRCYICNDIISVNVTVIIIIIIINAPQIKLC